MARHRLAGIASPSRAQSLSEKGERPARRHGRSTAEIERGPKGAPEIPSVSENFLTRAYDTSDPAENGAGGLASRPTGCDTDPLQHWDLV